MAFQVTRYLLDPLTTVSVTLPFSAVVLSVVVSGGLLYLLTMEDPNDTLIKVKDVVILADGAPYSLGNMDAVGYVGSVDLAGVIYAVYVGI